MIICILGRQPALGRAELEALYGSQTVRPVGTQAMCVDASVDFARLGGSIKAGTVLATIPSTTPQKAFQWLQKNLADAIGPVEGKLKLGVSLYDLEMPVSKLNANMLTLKKALKTSGQSVRVVPNNAIALSSAQTYHNNLTDERGCEVMIVRDGNSMIIARATDVQAIDAYRKRDRERPKRDAFVGMLPPKLAQIIVNLAAGRLAETDNAVVLDPFCGTGVVPQEAALMGYQIYGSDISEKMIDYSRINLEWLSDKYRLSLSPRFEVASATEHVWRQPLSAIACEGYLGQPFSAEPAPEKLRDVMKTCDLIMKKFLQNLGEQIEPGTPLCIAAPAWHIKGRFKHLPVLDDLKKLGYNRIDFVHADRDSLIYHREDQIVGRELVVLTKE